MTTPAPNQVPQSDRRVKPVVSTWIVAGIAVILLISGTATSGFPGFLIMLGFIGLITALYSLATGRKSWALIPSRKIAAVVLAGCLVTTGVGGAIARGPSLCWS
ncbi:MAG: hypothetical protein JWN09_2634 [Microbacteriaceae bacterium]|nr:hypothetical protein [Microbacteriaceae bacterium]